MSAGTLRALLDPAAIRLRVPAPDWRAATRAAGELLLARGCIEARYIDAMIQLIETVGPYVVLVPGFALLHARPESGVLRAGISLVTLDPAVAFGHSEHDPVAVAVGLAAPDHHAHLEALRVLATRLEDADLVPRLAGAETPAEVLALLTGKGQCPG